MYLIFVDSALQCRLSLTSQFPILVHYIWVMTKFAYNMLCIFIPLFRSVYLYLKTRKQKIKHKRDELNYGCSMSFCLRYTLFLENIERSSQSPSKAKPSQAKWKTNCIWQMQQLSPSQLIVFIHCDLRVWVRVPVHKVLGTRQLKLILPWWNACFTIIFIVCVRAGACANMNLMSSHVCNNNFFPRNITVFNV